MTITTIKGGQIGCVYNKNKEVISGLAITYNKVLPIELK